MRTLDIAIGAKRPEPVLRSTLEGRGHSCAIFDTTASILAGLRRAAYDGVIIDLDCQAIAWREVIERRTNAMSPDFFVIVTGSKAAQALEAGADDFLGTPIVPDEVQARLLQVFRKRARVFERLNRAAMAGCVLDVERGSLTGQVGTAWLTSRELAIAQLLFAHAGNVLSRRRLAHEIWCCDEELVSHSIEQHIYQLRRKLGRCAGDTLKLRGIYGGGYRLDAIETGGTTCSPA